MPEERRPEAAPRPRRPRLAARVTGIVILVVVALPAIAGGIYAIASGDFPEGLRARLGPAPEAAIVILGALACALGAAALAVSLALLIWPDRALSPRAPLGRALGRLINSRTRRRRDRAPRRP